jgi:hypothetical protein
MARLRKLQLDGLSDEERYAAVTDRLIERHGYPLVADALNALNSGRGEAEYSRAHDVLRQEEDPERILKAFEAWLAPFINEQVGANQRANAGNARRGKHRHPPATLKDAVIALRNRDVARHPPNGLRTFSDVCAEVAKRFGYAPSAKSVKEAAKAARWIDPRRA